MSEFKFGDDVKVTGNGDRENGRIEHYFDLGDRGVVMGGRDYDGDYLVAVDGIENYVHESHLEKDEDEDEQTLDIGRMKDEPEDDATNPGHYKFSNGAEVIDITEHLSFNGGNAVKYLARSTREDGNNKGNVLEDLRKAAWYVAREIERIENNG